MEKETRRKSLEKRVHRSPSSLKTDREDDLGLEKPPSPIGVLRTVYKESVST